MNSSKPYIIMPHWPTLLYEGRNGQPLAHTRELLAKLGHPEKKLPPVVHVAGTNGKGSTIAFLRAMLEAAGKKVHVYTQPHLHRFNERIVLAGKPIDDTRLFEVIEQARLAAGDTHYSFFEGTTAAAILAFSQAPADILLMETGCGGRFDPTNVVETPALTILTTISYDHVGILGDTLSQIAWHKAGIMRPEVPCIMSFQAPEVMEVLLYEANEMGSLPCVYGIHWRTQRSEAGLLYATAEGVAEFPAPNLPGPHQYLNAANAITAATMLEGIALTQENVVYGLTHAHWPGRLERITEGGSAKLLKEGWELWIDGGHNLAAGYAMAAHLETNWQNKPTYLIFGTTQGKDVEGIIKPLVPHIKACAVMPVISEPHSYSADILENMIAPLGVKVMQAENAGNAIETLMQQGEPGRILVFGSMYLRVLFT